MVNVPAGALRPAQIAALRDHVRIAGAGLIVSGGDSSFGPGGYEKSPLEGGGHQRKYHAPGVGIVQVGAVGDPEGETLVLVEIVHLNQGALAQARKEALKLDERAYEVSDVYQQTPPAERA